MIYPYFATLQLGHREADNETGAPSTRDTMSSCYGFEFYPEDQEGGIVIEQTFYRAQKNCFSLRKPGQIWHAVHPANYYHFALATEDSTLLQGLNSLPTFGYHPEMGTIITLCQRMAQIPEKTQIHARLEAEGCICIILSMLIQHSYPISDRSDFRISRYQKALVAADKYLRSHIQENVDLDKLARDSGLHPTYFHKLFTTAFGKTPAQQLNMYRIHNALSYLTNTSRSVAEVAFQCGYSSPNYFAFKFKEATDMTPTQFRKLHKNTQMNGK